MVASTTPPADAGDGHKIFRRSRGEAIDIATAAGLNVRVHVLEIEDGQVRLLCIAPQEVRFTPRTRQEAKHRARRRRA